jgi:hypothetical protein
MAKSSECRWFQPANKNARGTRDAWSEDFPPPGVSGVYAIASLETAEVFYVGQSHSGRLRKTIARHFQAWTDEQARAVYDRHRVQVCWARSAPAEALGLEALWIEDLNPRDNDLGYSGGTGGGEDGGGGGDTEPPF